MWLCRRLVVVVLLVRALPLPLSVLLPLLLLPPPSFMAPPPLPASFGVLGYLIHHLCGCCCFSSYLALP